MRALADIKAPIAASTGASALLSSPVRSDLEYAQHVISQAVTASSWDRNASWVRKFSQYISTHCQGQLRAFGAMRTVTSDTIATAFLASVVKENPGAYTRITAAKRAINLLRAFARKPPLDNNPSVRFLARGARKAVVRTKRQSPALLAVYVAAIVYKWGFSKVWWKSQVALMALLTFCTLARGAGITACLRRGISWVRKDGSQPRNHATFMPGRQCEADSCNHPSCVRGFLLLFPTRKNHRDSPSWIPVAETSAMKMMRNHLSWLRTLPPGDYMFLARKRCRSRGRHGVSFAPNTNPKSRMSTSSFRYLLRFALVQCCGLSWANAKMFGTHSPRSGSLEELRKCGVPAELRQQLGAWMSQAVALSYLQLNPGAQFDVLRAIGS